VTKNNLKIKTKFANHLMLDGGKKISEKIILKSFKNLQKVSKKQINNVIRLSLLYATPIFKLHKIANKKVKKKKKKIRIIPAFIPKILTRISLGIKYILFNINKKKTNKFLFNKLQEEILVIAQNNGAFLEIKKETQQQTLLNKRYFRYYRW
jgi:ribosomal protein S7